MTTTPTDKLTIDETKAHMRIQQFNPGKGIPGWDPDIPARDTSTPYLFETFDSDELDLSFLFNPEKPLNLPPELAKQCPQVLSMKGIADFGRRSDPNDFNKNFEDARTDIFCLIAQYESVKAKAYQNTWYDKVNKKKKLDLPTIGWGLTQMRDPQTNTWRPVTLKDKFTTFEQIQGQYNNYIDDKLYPYMEEHLPLDKMTSAEIAAVASLAYNCGSGVISGIAPAIKEYCDTRDNPAAHKIATQKVEDLFLKKPNGNRRSLQERRHLEFAIFNGDIVMQNNKPCTKPNEIDFTQNVSVYYLKETDFRNFNPTDSVAKMKNPRRYGSIIDECNKQLQTPKTKVARSR